MEECELYFKNKEKYSYKINGSDILLNNLCEEHRICLRGDNLITRKQMYRRVVKNDKSKLQNQENNGDIYSFIIMPHIKNDVVKCQLNSKRASCAKYNDNPFIFFKSLKNLYEKNFKEDNPDKVETLIIKSKPYWETFGINTEGYKEYLNVFCLNCIDSLMIDDEYKTFFNKYEKKVEWGQREWEAYNGLLKHFHKLRKDEILQRRKV